MARTQGIFCQRSTCSDVVKVLLRAIVLAAGVGFLG